MTNEQAERILELEAELVNYKDDAENELRILREEYDKIHGLLRKTQSRLARYDDTRPINEEYAKSIGFVLNDDGCKTHYTHAASGIELVFLQAGRLFEARMTCELYGLYVIPRRPNRGQLHNLLDALGIGGGDTDTNSNEGE